MFCLFQKVRLRHSVLLLFLLLTARASVAQCRATSSDTSFTSLADPQGYTREFQGDAAPSYIRVTRVVGPGTVGPGTASEFNADGTFVDPTTYQQTGVLSPDAYVQVSAVMTLGASFWELASIGGYPLAAQVEVTFTLNG